MVVAVPLVLLLLFLALGMPIAFALGVSGSIGLFFIGGWDLVLGIIQTTPYDSTANFLFTTIPMFILMAELMTASGITKDIFKAAHKWLGNLPGGLGIATVFAGAGLGAVSGSSTASAATLSASAYPEMQKYGYSTPFSMGVASISGTLAIMIPPSIVLILYGIMTETGIGSLLIAGIIPGIITALGYVVTIWIWAKIDPKVAPRVTDKPTIREKFQSLAGIWPMLVIMLVVIGGIYAGVVTATEAGALGAFATFIVALAMKRLTFEKINEALKRTLKSTAMIMTIVIGAMILGYFLTATQVTQKMITFVQDAGYSRWLILVLVIILYLILGVFMDQMAILILTLPLTFPLVTSLGFNPIWFGIIVTKTAEIGLVTPPVGMNVFVAAGAAGVRTAEAFKGVTWFVIADLILLLILILFPFLSTWLPDLMMK
ncbi:TRAP dicarboxylate transporter subunit DctM [Neobacillus bataviensis LMG 21833]|uniref:TRAP dicarboxylate transporter subunit DctM n=1 Tax=Neobacillus bataviensis LMG 21833 TaxID=1117379 RepID=K6DF81_9BACI|nr:TRAP transporter large permease subunit [Neobacillus bataviensis]EKN66964.1 TRAP dicarboxylate transporter subunit DctM [Neobacillus bataviensis LMG 21833]